MQNVAAQIATNQVGGITSGIALSPGIGLAVSNLSFEQVGGLPPGVDTAQAEVMQRAISVAQQTTPPAPPAGLTQPGAAPVPNASILSGLGNPSGGNNNPFGGNNR